MDAKQSRLPCNLPGSSVGPLPAYQGNDGRNSVGRQVYKVVARAIILVVESTLKTLPARYYTDPELFQQEVERFFFGSWICAGRVEQIQEPGEYFLRDVCGENVIVTRDSSGALRAFYNICRHRGTRMCTATEGKLPGRIQCPYHGWTYGLDGRLIGAPQMDEDFSREELPPSKRSTATSRGYETSRCAAAAWKRRSWS